tara:strand:+ start:181 stop:870 length:690 start_codon:yes stop_codon:yes gene_type:complete
MDTIAVYKLLSENISKLTNMSYYDSFLNLKLELSIDTKYNEINITTINNSCLTPEKEIKCLCSQQHLRYTHLFTLKNVDKYIILGSTCVKTFYEYMYNEAKAKDKYDVAKLIEFMVNYNNMDCAKQTCASIDCDIKYFTTDKHNYIYCIECRRASDKIIKKNAMIECVICNIKAINPTKLFKNEVRQKICFPCFKLSKCKDCNKIIKYSINKYNNIVIRCKTCYCINKY